MSMLYLIWRGVLPFNFLDEDMCPSGYTCYPCSGDNIYHWLFFGCEETFPQMSNQLDSWRDIVFSIFLFSTGTMWGHDPTKFIVFVLWWGLVTSIFLLWGHAPTKQYHLCKMKRTCALHGLWWGHVPITYIMFAVLQTFHVALTYCFCEDMIPQMALLYVLWIWLVPYIVFGW